MRGRIARLTLPHRTQNSITVRFGDRDETYDLLHILDFDNDRKRISVIVKQHGRIFLYCKGADSKIEERLDPSERGLMAITNDHLHVNNVLSILTLSWFSSSNLPRMVCELFV